MVHLQSIEIVDNIVNQCLSSNFLCWHQRSILTIIIYYNIELGTKFTKLN